MTNINQYIKFLSKLKRATKNGIKAPHKPVLLLSLMQSIANGEISQNAIEISPQLVARFKDNWNWLVKDHCFNPNFALPFYHLTSDGFWYLKTFAGKEILLTSSLSIKSFAQLKEVVNYAYLDEHLFQLLLQKESREIIYQYLLQHYFNTAANNQQPTGLFETVTQQILHEDAVQYRTKINLADEEEIFVRSNVFKRVVPQTYNYTCCISGMHIVTGHDIQMVDACHIVPFALSKNDTISNGLSLSPNMHRAFDRGIITISNDHKVIVSNSFTETSIYSIRQYHNRTILLPQQIEFYPSGENLVWHREHVFKG